MLNQDADADGHQHEAARHLHPPADGGPVANAKASFEALAALA